MIGELGLNHHFAGQCVTASAAGNLSQQGKQIFLRTKVGENSARSVIDDPPTSVSAGKSWPLASIWVPTTMSTFAGEDALVQLAPRVFARERIGVGTSDARVGKASISAASSFLRVPTPAPTSSGGHRRAFRRHAGLRAAVMAAQRARGLMQRHLASQRLHGALQPQCGQYSAGAKPRRLTSTRLCSPRLRRAAMPSASASDNPAFTRRPRAGTESQ